MRYIIACFGIPNNEEDLKLISNEMEKVARYGKKAFFPKGKKGSEFVSSVLNEWKSKLDSSVEIVKVSYEEDKPDPNYIDRYIIFQTKKSKEKSPQALDADSKEKPWVPRIYIELDGLVKIDGDTT